MREYIKKIINEIKVESDNDESDDVNLSGHKNYSSWVFIHRNLNKPPYWSIKQGKSGGQVIGYDKTIKLRDVEFKVQKGGQSRVRKEKRKNVHAGVVGKIISSGENYDTKGWTLVTYNPYVHNSFVEEGTDEPIYRAKEAILKNTKEVWVKKYDDDSNLNEDWSEKYKKSIDCNNPKGFSQRAHCQGRKKRDLDEYSRTLKMARRQGSGVRFPQSAVKNSPSRFRNYSRQLKENEEGEESEDKIQRLIIKIISRIITRAFYSRNGESILMFDKSNKCLFTYNITGKKLWYDHSILEKEVEQRLRINKWIKDDFKKAAQTWFNEKFKSYGFVVGNKTWISSSEETPNVQGAHIDIVQ